MRLNKRGYILTVYTEIECYTYLFDNYEDAIQQMAEYTAVGVQTDMRPSYTID